jgi:hypothetical protein
LPAVIVIVASSFTSCALAAGVEQNHDQVVPAFVLKPLLAATVDVQLHRRQRPPWAPFAMHPTLASPRYQPSTLEHAFLPSYSRARSGALWPASRENAADYHRNSSPDSAPTPAPTPPWAPASAKASLASGQTARETSSPRNGPASACAGPIPLRGLKTT